MQKEDKEMTFTQNDGDVKFEEDDVKRENSEGDETYAQQFSSKCILSFKVMNSSTVSKTIGLQIIP
jgi:hypothetical protein